MNVVTVFLLFALIFSLAGNAALFIRFYEVRSGLDDTINALIRARNEVGDRENAINRLHIMYQRKLDDQQRLFIHAAELVKKREERQGSEQREQMGDGL